MAYSTVRRRFEKNKGQNPDRKMTSFITWNGFPARTVLIKKLQAKYFGNSPSPNKPFDDIHPKIWLRLPYLGKQGFPLFSNHLDGY